MDIKVIHMTESRINNEEQQDGLKDAAMLLGGREAGICYMQDDYFSNKINNSEAALKRAAGCVKSGHHSPFDHFNIGLEIQGIPKIVAMILNSTELYTTSEKSARYVVMNPETQLEADIYYKWTIKIKDLIHREYPNIESRDMDKLAIENARYMLSVFTPTSMGYTISFRQLNYLVGWLEDLENKLTESKDRFDQKLLPYIVELREKLAEIGDCGIRDIKGGKLRLLRKQNGIKPFNGKKYIGDVYQVSYKASFASLAQLQRHRTIHYEMEFNDDSLKECYVPRIIRNDVILEDEWKKDFEKLKEYYPQCTMVNVIEQGKFTDFIMKCKERLCGRAQLETMVKTANLMNTFISNIDNLSDENQELLRECTLEYGGNLGCCPRCQFKDYKCNEPCRWGSRGLERNI